jgi:transcriptional regulator with XRE-family HTH domain
MDDLGIKLTKVMNGKGMTQADVCRITGFSTAVVSQVFSGKTKDPRLSTIIPICKALGVTVDELLSTEI